MQKVTHAQKRNPYPIWKKILQAGRYPWRNHLCKFFWWSVKGLRGLGVARDEILPFLSDFKIHTIVWIFDYWHPFSSKKLNGLRFYVDIPLAHRINYSHFFFVKVAIDLYSVACTSYKVPKLHSAWAIHSEKSNKANLMHFRLSLFAFQKHRVK